MGDGHKRSLGGTVVAILYDWSSAVIASADLRVERNLAQKRYPQVGVEIPPMEHFLTLAATITDEVAHVLNEAQYR